MSKNYNTSRAYEQLVRRLVDQQLSGIDGLDLVEIKHDVRMDGLSGHSHQVDVVYSFRMWATDFLVVVECKQYARSVRIDDLLEFKARLDDLRAHKGLFVTTTGFQKGAVEFAKANRIALLIARGTESHAVLYQRDDESALDRCQQQLEVLRVAYQTEDTPRDLHLTIDRRQRFVKVARTGVSLRLAPGELHLDMLYLRAVGIGDEENVKVDHFVDSRIGNVASGMIFKALVLEVLLTSGG